ncbi:MAG: hypothetical protein KDB86_04735 [Actinobacteria bacterium]|nr:hypothetical protein [Actinomycetota bacterium]MCB9389946.1 hypothetical protein [Acidimicrobiia bacterium]
MSSARPDAATPNRYLQLIELRGAGKRKWVRNVLFRGVLAAAALVGCVEGDGGATAQTSIVPGRAAEAQAPKPARVLPPSEPSTLSIDEEVAIARFLDAHVNDPDFGALWIDQLGDRKVVHVRYLDAAFKDEVDDLERSLTVDVVSHHGGASAEYLNALVELFRRSGQSIEFNVNSQEGFLDVYESSASNLPEEIALDPFVRVVPDPVEPPIRLEPRSAN